MVVAFGTVSITVAGAASPRCAASDFGRLTVLGLFAAASIADALRAGTPSAGSMLGLTPPSPQSRTPSVHCF